ncbi:MAG: DUF1538 domain-containing protein [Lachnospiraceae bacterium]|nr:DUF1538 domain-containing protein [Lachnospiraceae bacterium]
MPGKNQLWVKIEEAFTSVWPILAIVLLLCFTIVPVPTDLMLSFAVGSVLLIFGLGLFMFGAEHSMSVIGTYIGAKMTKSRKLWLIIVISFILGVIITVAEPDLQVLAGNVPHINSMVLILMVSVGVGFFLTMCMLRILFKIPLNVLLIISYVLIFILALNSDPHYISVAFDSGGVTTGPMTAPFIIALGVGVASIRSDTEAEENSFGLVALCSVGPILAVLILGFVYPGEEGTIAAASAGSYTSTVSVSRAYLEAIPQYVKEVALAMLPIIIFFLIFQKVSLKLPKIPFYRILFGLGCTFLGLFIFLLGVNVGFSSLGIILGESLVMGWRRYIIVPIFALMGWFVVRAEPAVHVLNKQVEEISAGAVSEKAMETSLSVAIALAMALSMVRVLTGISILWFVVPGYVIALVLSFFVPKIFTAIAFDSGGVASGPMSATFMLPFAMGACGKVGNNILTDAFGVVALVAMMPLITVQIMGVISVIKKKYQPATTLETFVDEDVIELWSIE